MIAENDETRVPAIHTRMQRCSGYNFGMRDADLLAHSDIPWLLDRLRATEAERDTIQRRTEEREARRYHAAIGNWKNIAQTAEARAAEAEAVIAEAYTVAMMHNGKAAAKVLGAYGRSRP